MLKKKKLLLIISALLLVLLAAALDCRLIVRHYRVEAAAIATPLRLALITDLHSCRYGENEQQLAAAIDKELPDIVLLGGDIFDDKIPDDNTAALLQSIADQYPCYYVTGNHEYWAGQAAFTTKMQILAAYGVKRLSGTTEELTINGQTITICGADDPDSYRIVKNARPADGLAAFQQQLANIAPNDMNKHNYTILLAHRPEYFALYAEQGFDLALCGHAHGGQWRLPGLINGVYAPNQGLLPKYAGGLYQQRRTTMIVSRGLARESTRIPRLFNRPELVIIDLT